MSVPIDYKEIDCQIIKDLLIKNSDDQLPEKNDIDQENDRDTFFFILSYIK